MKCCDVPIGAAPVTTTTSATSDAGNSDEETQPGEEVTDPLTPSTEPSKPAPIEIETSTSDSNDDKVKHIIINLDGFVIFDWF